ncbi:tRNA-dihydrouridine synthase [Danaus plexippus plexippus]|uniref:tRNA-dihydrouridine synthase n=1 Tax=Danaus plexippus plexippus TaxID=278856 RepID=A0A212EV25_DANPL|nr:tRNA-dihydrouridine synthase [Danaus plexippus plexippus]
MVRYSKVQFRTLVKNYGVDLCFTPMILADSFCQNEKARSNEFITTTNDTPLIVQFAANNVDDFVDASQLVYPYADGVDLNCGCPQRWAMKDGYGCALLSRPELVHNLLRSVRNNLPSHFSVSVKVRIFQDLKKTITMCQQLEQCGVNFMTVHGRTPLQKSGDNIDVEMLKEVCDLVKIPVVANGGIKSLYDAEQLYSTLNCDGIMVADGILNNPALFTGANKTPLYCVKHWMNLKDSSDDKITFQCYHHHLVFMLGKILTKKQKQEFNNLSDFDEVDVYIKKYVLDSFDGDVEVNHELENFVDCEFNSKITLKHAHKCRGCGKSICYCICAQYDYDSNKGNYFKSFVTNNDGIDFMDSNMFDECNL